MIQDHQLSERHACRLAGLSRDSYRNPPQPDQLTRELCERIVDIAMYAAGLVIGASMTCCTLSSRM